MDKLSDKVLLTGATGLIGLDVTKYLVAKGYEIEAIGRRPKPSWMKDPSINYHKGDIRDRSIIERVFMDIDHIIHMAAYKNSNENWELYQEVNIKATKNLFEIAIREKPERFIIISSLTNYSGRLMEDGVKVDEDFPLEKNLEKRRFYARSKTIQDKIAQKHMYDSRIDVTIIRPGIVLVEGRDNLLHDAAFPFRDLALLLLDDGNRQYPFIFGNDLAKGIVKILENIRCANEVYNLIYPHSPTRNEAVRAYKDVFKDDRTVVRLHLKKFDHLLNVMDQVEEISPIYHLHLAYKLKRFAAKVQWDGTKLGRHVDWTPNTSIYDTYEAINR